MKSELFVSLIIAMALIITTIVIIAFILWPVLPIPSGSVTGELVSYEIKPIDYDLMTYPYTRVTLKNYTITGDMFTHWNYYTTEEGTYTIDSFHFDGEYTDVEDLAIGDTYEFVYKKGSRPSDASPGESITQYYLLWINEVK